MLGAAERIELGGGSALMSEAWAHALEAESRKKKAARRRENFFIRKQGDRETRKQGDRA